MNLWPTLLALGLLALSALNAAGVEPTRSQALFEEAAALTDMREVSDKLRQAVEAGRGSLDGSRAALELARLEYAQDRPDAVLSILHSADGWPRDAELDGQWLYLRAQSRLLGKGLQRARDDFERLASAYPEHALAAASRLAAADCDAALRQDERASETYLQIISAQGPFAAQALWGLGVLRERQNRLTEAVEAYERLIHSYPASFEAAAAKGRAEALGHKQARPTPRAAPTPLKAAPKYYLRVGLYSRLGVAQGLVKALKRNHYKVQIKKLQIAGRDMVLVHTGPYSKRSQAEAEARRLKAQDKLDSLIEEE